MESKQHNRFYNLRKNGDNKNLKEFLMFRSNKLIVCRFKTSQNEIMKMCCVIN